MMSGEVPADALLSHGLRLLTYQHRWPVKTMKAFLSNTGCGHTVSLARSNLVHLPHVRLEAGWGHFSAICRKY